MEFQVGEIYSGFKLLEEYNIKEVNGVGRLFLHKKSGARLYHVENDDDNKVFSISFRTPPEDSTGLPHILEHSVLCGSRKFPSKEPFVELVKGSLNTFLNAMTFPDKTMYPIASKNEKDFMNLMDVYLDAVFYPLIYDNPNTLKQEGWHYELEDPDGDISYKGVVYNEMKGAFSQPESVLYRKIQEELFPDTPYGVESGGDPEFIPDLTQEQFTNFHKKYYHPSNSFIYIYGDGDIRNYLRFIHEEYLNDFERIEIESRIPIQKPFNRPKDVSIYYPISKNEREEDKTFLSLSYVVGKSTDAELYLAFDILSYLLLETPSAPLRRALIDANLGKDVSGSFDNSILQPIFNIVVKNSNPDKKEKFLAVAQDTLRKLVNEGIDKKLIEAAINIFEFQLREADHGSYPKGLIYGIQIMDSWLYDSDPSMHLRYENILDKIKSALTTDYFEKLIERYLLNNNHRALLMVEPKKGLAEERERRTQKKLAEYKSNLTKEEINDLIQETKDLIRMQMTPDSKEDLNTIPLLNIEDINPKAEDLPLVKRRENNIDILFHPLFTNGIAYVNLYFDARVVPQALLPYISLLSQLLGKLSTQRYHYEDLSNEINIHTGGIYFRVEAFGEMGTDEIYYPKFVVKSRAMVDKLPRLHELIKEIISSTDFFDEKRLKEVIQESKSRLERKIQNRGHLVVAHRLYSYFSPIGHYLELMNGIEYYKFLERLEANFNNSVEEIQEKLMEVSRLIFNRKDLLISVTSEEKDYNKFTEYLPVLVEDLRKDDNGYHDYHFELGAKNEGWMTSSEVQYVGQGYNFKKLGFTYDGSYQVLKTILSYDYLWSKVRVQGGAYGVFFNIGKDGNMFVGSYRDPNLVETLDVYNGIGDYLKEFDPDEREMRKYIIGTISRLDTPLTSSAKGEEATSRYIRNISYRDVQQERTEILFTTKEKIREASALVEKAMDQNYICVLGNEDKIVQAKMLFKNLHNLFK